MTMTGLKSDIATAYRRFGEHEARGNSEAYRVICAAIAEDDDVLRLIAALPPGKRQPNLMLASSKYLGAPEYSSTELLWYHYREWLLDHWAEVAAVVRQRATQTNEPGRCAVLLPFVREAQEKHASADDVAPGPIALLEVGCLAGLTLFIDAYSYRYETVSSRDGDDGARPAETRNVTTLGSGAPQFTCRLDGVPAPQQMPDLGWRGGLDPNTLDASDPEDVAWLDAIVWPGQNERLAQAARVAASAAEKPHLVQGDLVRDLDALVAEVPAELPLVLFHTAVLAYPDDATRRAFRAKMAELASRPGGFTWISNEAPGVFPDLRAKITGEMPTGRFLVAVDGEPRAFAGPHGQSLTALDA